METHTQIPTHNSLRLETDHTSITREGVNKPYDNIVLLYYSATKINPTPTLVWANPTTVSILTFQRQPSQGCARRGNGINKQGQLQK